MPTALAIASFHLVSEFTLKYFNILTLTPPFFSFSHIFILFHDCRRYTRHLTVVNRLLRTIQSNVRNSVPGISMNPI